MTKLIIYLLAFSFSFFTLAKPSYAHAFGALYNLPVPFWLYLWGGAATLIISFVLVGFFLNRSESVDQIKLIHLKNLDFLISPTMVSILKAASVLLLLLTVVSGLFGVDNSLSNINMTLFWILFLLGFYYLTAIVGDIYSVLNPFKIMFGTIKSKLVNYPANLGYLPALIFFLGLIWIELFLGISPFKLSLVLVIYTIINFLGTNLIGEESWFKYCELFSVLFRLIGKISPFQVKNQQVYLRPPLTGLTAEQPEHFSLVIFIMFMLSSTAYDGLHTTLPWYRLILSLNFDAAFLQRLGLILSPFVFLALFLIFTFLMKLVIGTTLGIIKLSKNFAFSLVPIALAYNIAHYYTLLINQGQEMIRLISDPLGLNWNLFGTADFQSKLFTDAGFIWHSQVGVILIGHITAVYLAHVIALKVFKTRKLAITFG